MKPVLRRQETGSAGDAAARQADCGKTWCKRSAALPVNAEPFHALALVSRSLQSVRTAP
jgi:hypothetical protein